MFNLKHLSLKKVSLQGVIGFTFAVAPHFMPFLKPEQQNQASVILAAIAAINAAMSDPRKKSAKASDAPSVPNA